jgi:hypothetical protein
MIIGAPAEIRTENIPIDYVMKSQLQNFGKFYIPYTYLA